MGASLSAVNSHFESTAKSLTGRQGLRGKVERFGKMSSKVKEKIPEIKPLANEIQPEKLELLVEPLEPEQLPEEVEDEAPVA
jgi:DNA recombination protein RmuC